MRMSVGFVAILLFTVLGGGGLTLLHDSSADGWSRTTPCQGTDGVLPSHGLPPILSQRGRVINRPILGGLRHIYAWAA